MAAYQNSGGDYDNIRFQFSHEKRNVLIGYCDNGEKIEITGNYLLLQKIYEKERILIKA